MARRIARLLFFLVFLFASAKLNSTVVRILDVASLTRQADLIVVGQATTIVDRGPGATAVGERPILARQFSAGLRADQVIKGSSPGQNLTVDFTVPQAPTAIQPVVADQYGVFFLSLTDGQLRFTDPVYPCLPAIPGFTVSSGSVLDQVTNVLGQVLESPSVSDSDRHRVLDALGRLETGTARDTLRHALNNASQDIRLDAARVLVARNDVAGLPLVEDALLHPAGLSEQMVSNLSGSLAGLNDPRSIPVLKRLVQTNNQQTVRAAAIALRQSRSPDALAPLATLLDNPDQQVRYYAVAGMAETTRQDEWTPSFEEFRDHEDKYVGHWREWARSNLSAQTPK